jgi:hypothetical protein
MSFDPEYLDILNLAEEDLPADILKLKQDTRTFIQNNCKYWSASTIAQFLGIDLAMVHSLSPQTTFKTNIHNVLIVKPLADAEYDSLRAQGGLI